MGRTSIQQKLGKKIRSLRIEQNMTQEKLGELTNLDRTYISGIERGLRNPSIKSLEKIAKALDTKVVTLLSY